MKLLKVTAAALGALLLVMLFAGALVERIEPGEIGVRQNLWGDGIVEEDFGAGFHLGILGMHAWHRLDRRTHFLTFSETEGRDRASYAPATANSMERPPLEIRTVDNNAASLDVTITYRIIEGQGHELVSTGQMGTYRERVASSVQGVLREELAKLRPEDFVDSDTRLQLVEETLPKLRASLAKFNVEPESLLIRAVRFPDKYEAELQRKQLQQQLSRLEEAKQRVEEALTVTGKISEETEALEKETRAEWDKRLQELASENEVKIAQVLGESRKYDARVRSEADAKYEELVAEGQLALERAEALRDELRNAALDTKGGRLYQARAAAENLVFETVTLNSNDPSIPSVIDIDALVDILVGREGGEAPAARETANR